VTDCYWGISAYSSYHLVENNILVDNVLGLSTPWGCRPTFKNNTVTGGKYVKASTGIYSLFSECTIINNLIYDHAAGIATDAEDSSYIANNLIYNCGWEAILLDEPAPDAPVENNTVIMDLRTGRQAIFFGYSSLKLTNNIVVGGDIGIRSYAANSHLYYNNVWGSNTYYFAEGGGSIDTVIGNIHEDPMFVDSLDFHLQMHSPCIDAGHPDIKDPDSSRSDMGAFGGPFGESYAYQDLPPKAPDSLEATIESTLLIISWKPNTEADLSHYCVYKDSTAFFDPDSSRIVGEVQKDSSVFRDSDFVSGSTYYYKISAWDLSGHQSPYSEELEVSVTAVPWEDQTQVMTRTYELYQNHPNPFNPRTSISYHLPDIGYQPAEAEIIIYNLLGRKVRTLVHERQYPGRHTAAWDGKDDEGNDLSSGIYFYKLRLNDSDLYPLIKPKKMVLIR